MKKDPKAFEHWLHDVHRETLAFSTSTPPFCHARQGHAHYGNLVLSTPRDTHVSSESSGPVSHAEQSVRQRISRLLGRDSDAIVDDLKNVVATFAA